MTDLRVRALSPDDHAAWVPLFTEYREFCGRRHDPTILDRVWKWLMSNTHEVHGVVVEKQGDVVAIAHYRTFLRTVDGDHGLHLDDLYVAREARGNGTARALLGHLGDIAQAENAAFVRWVTAEDNEGARRLYEQVADETSWVTFELTPAG